MKKTILWICALIVVASCVAFGVAALTGEHSGKGEQPSEDTAKAWYDEMELDASTVAKLDELEAKGKLSFGRYWYAEKLLTKETAPLETRLMLEDAKKIVSEAASFEEAKKRFAEWQPWPDFAGGSGVSLVEYWFDDEGKEKILMLLEQGQIYHVIGDQSELLFGKE